MINSDPNLAGQTAQHLMIANTIGFKNNQGTPGNTQVQDASGNWIWQEQRSCKSSASGVFAGWAW